MCNIRTVNSFGNEHAIEASYAKKLEGPASLVNGKGLKAGIAFGFS